MATRTVFIVQRCQDLDMMGESMAFDHEIVQVFADRRSANEYVRKHENEIIPEEDQNPDYEYNNCRYDYTVISRSVK